MNKGVEVGIAPKTMLGYCKLSIITRALILFSFFLKNKINIKYIKCSNQIAAKNYNLIKI